MAKRVEKGLGVLLHYARESNERQTKQLKDQREQNHETRGAYSNSGSSSLETQQSPPRGASPSEKDAPPYSNRHIRRILIHA